jgi:hypothetical protein
MSGKHPFVRWLTAAAAVPLLLATASGAPGYASSPPPPRHSAASAVVVPRGDATAISAATWLAYRRAIVDAAVATPAEVAHDLVPISRTNRLLRWRLIGRTPYVLVQTLRWNALGRPGQRVVLTNDRWVSIPAQLAARCRSAGCGRMGDGQLDLRLKQLNGLAPDGDYTYVNRFWARAADIFRPCTDPRTTTTSCPTQVPAGGPVPALVGHTAIASFLWSQANYAWRMPERFAGSASVSCAAASAIQSCYGFPWTRLGYTYDWRPGAREEGPSEFVVVRGAVVVMQAVLTQRQAFPRG